MGDLALRIEETEAWPRIDDIALDAFAAAGAAPAAVFFPGAGANRRETDDVAVVLRELARKGLVRACVIGTGEGGAKRRFGVVAAPSLLLLGPKGGEVVPLIADWGDYLAAIAAVSQEIAA